ncbi:MAG TPA: hypothetical protein VGE65_02975 [Sphingobium sp.]
MNHTKLSRAYSTWIDDSLKPDIYVVATVKQHIFVHSHESRMRIVGDQDRYAAIYDQFICRLSKAVFGAKNWRRHKKRIANAATLEGNGYRPVVDCGITKKSVGHLNRTQSVFPQVRYHLNMMFRRPAHLTFEQFEAIIYDVWMQSEWALADILIEERTGQCVAYSCKEGPETILTNSMRF